MEGLYLHNLIFRALFMDPSNSITYYVTLGWGKMVMTNLFDIYCKKIHFRFTCFSNFGMGFI